MTEQQYKYFAFISYSYKDKQWGDRLQIKLENYRMPAALCREHGWERTPIRPVFYAPSDIQPAPLSEELQNRLKASKNLIVICSPNSAKSKWVGEEIKFFYELGRTKHMHFFIVDGQPHSGSPNTECFNPVVDTLGLPEILGANIHEKIYRWPWMNKERAYVQLVSKLLGVEFDAIWQRHRRLLLQKIIGRIIGVMLVIAAMLGVYISNQPVDVEVRLNEVSVHNPNLPPLKDGIVTITLDNETKSDTIRSLETSICFSNIPHRFLNKNVHVRVESQNYLSMDTVMILSEKVIVDIYRAPNVFGNVYFQLWNTETEQTLTHAELFVDDHKVISDDSGYVSLSIPLALQKKTYPVRAKTISLEDSVLIMPCGPDDRIRFK